MQLKVHENPYIIDEQNDIADPIMKTIKKYKHHSSMLLFNSSLSNLKSFSFN